MAQHVVQWFVLRILRYAVQHCGHELRPLTSLLQANFPGPEESTVHAQPCQVAQPCICCSVAPPAMGAYPASHAMPMITTCMHGVIRHIISFWLIAGHNMHAALCALNMPLYCRGYHGAAAKRSGDSIAVRSNVATRLETLLV